MTAEQESGSGHETTDVIGCSVRGQKNVERETPCQDNNEQRSLPGQRYVIAAADGLGSARLSHIGSRVATQAVANYVEKTLGQADSLSKETLRSVLRKAIAHSRKKLHEAARSREVPVSELNTTLLVAVGGPAGVGGAAVGDGGVVWHRGGQTDLLVPREDTEYGNQTIPVQSDNWKESYRFGWAPDADAAAVFSDGLDGVAWDGPASVSDELFDQVFDSLSEFSDLDKLEAFLEEFLNGAAIRRSSRDDKTLVIGAVPAARWSDPVEVEPQENSHGGRRKETSTDTSRNSSKQTGGTSRQRTEYGTGERTTSSVAIGEQYNDNGLPRIAVVAGVAVLVVAVVLAAMLVVGPFSGGDGSGADGSSSGGDGTGGDGRPSGGDGTGGGGSSPGGDRTGGTGPPWLSPGDVGNGGTLKLFSATLMGADGLVVNGTASDGVVNLTVEVRKVGHSQSGGQEAQSSDDPLVSANKTLNTGNNEQFNITLNSSTLDIQNFDYYGGTEYTVIAETGESSKETRLERGELSLTLDDYGWNDSTVTVNGTLTQGGRPIHKRNPEMEITAGNDDLQPEVNYNSSTGKFNFTGNIEAGTNLTVGFPEAESGSSEATDTLAVPVFAVDTVPTENVEEGEKIEIEFEIRNTANTEQNRTITLHIPELGDSSTEVTLGSGNSTTRTLSVETDDGDAGEYTANITSETDIDSTNVTVEDGIPPSSLSNQAWTGLWSGQFNGGDAFRMPAEAGISAGVSVYHSRSEAHATGEYHGQ